MQKNGRTKKNAVYYLRYTQQGIKYTKNVYNKESLSYRINCLL